MPTLLDNFSLESMYYGSRNISKAFLGSLLVFGEDPFIFQIETTSDGETFTLPLHSSSTINSFVRWGDSSTDTITSYNQPEITHTYATAGIHTIEMGGTVNGFRFNNSGDKLKIRNIYRWGCFDWSMYATFRGCSNMVINAVDRPLITTNEFWSEFSDCTSITKIPGIKNWDITSVTEGCGYLFNNCTSLTSIDVSDWDVSNLTSLINMFRGSSLVSTGDISGWDVSNSESFLSMFADSSITDIDISGWDLTGADSGNAFSTGIFYGCGSVQNITATNIIIGNKINYMFQDTTGLQSLNISSSDWTSVASATSAFNNCGLNTIDISHMSLSLSDVDYMFGNLTSTTTVNISNLSFGQDTSTQFMFTVNGSNDSDTGTKSSVTSIICENIDASASNVSLEYMFYRQTSLQSLDVSTWDTSGVVNMQAMFYDTRGLTSAIVGLNSFDTSNVENFNFAMGQEQLANGAPFGGGFVYNLSNWRLTSATNVTEMFKNNRMISSLNVSNWDVGNITSFDSMFETLDYCGTMTGLNTWDVSNAQNFTQMFINNKINTNIDISSWNTSSATNVTEMLYDCDSFNESLSAWDITSITTGLDSLLQNASGLTRLYYNSTLIGWSVQGPFSYSGNVNMGGSTYTAGGSEEAARDTLISSGLIMIDGGPS